MCHEKENPLTAGEEFSYICFADELKGGPRRLRSPLTKPKEEIDLSD